MTDHSGDLIVAASRASVLTTVGRWLLHDIRNPLQTLALVPELLRHAEVDRDDDGTRELLVATTRRLSSGLELLERTIRVEPDDGARPHDPATALAFFDRLRRCHRSRAAVEVQYDEAGLPAITCAEGPLVQVLLALLLNALDALEDRDDGRVEIAARPERGGLAVTVEDNGPGVAPAIAPRLFEPFATTHALPRGTGLAAARELLRRCGGTIAHGQPPAGGARFTIWIPAWGE